MGGYDSGSGSQDDRDEEDDEEEYEESGGGNRFLGFMFGNVDNSGDLDADYLDEDAKEHLGALADKLGTSLPDIDLSMKSPQISADAAEQDYDEKAEDAVDYEDINEQYDGPEVEAASEEEYVLPKEQYFSSEVSLSTLEHKTSIFGDENYDEDEDEQEEAEKQHMVEDTKPEVLTRSSMLHDRNYDKDGQVEAGKAHVVVDSQPVLTIRNSVFDDENYDEDVEEVEGGRETFDEGHGVETALSGQQDVGELKGGRTSPRHDMQITSTENEDIDIDMRDSHEEEVDDVEPRLDSKGPIPLPILCVEDGMVILRFSEIFGVHEPLKKGGKRDHRYSVLKDRYKFMDNTYIVEEDEEAILKCSSQVFPSRLNANDVSVLDDDDLDSAKFSGWREADKTTDPNKHQRKISYLSEEPMNENLATNLAEGWNLTSCSNFYPLDQQDWEDKILWGNSPTVSDNNTEWCDTPVDDLRMSFTRETNEYARAENLCSEVQLEHDGENHNIVVHSGPVVLESLSCADSSEPGQFPLSESKYHPQLLRLESRMGMDESNLIDSTKEISDVEVRQSDLLRRLSKLTLQNRDMAEGSWLGDIIWEPRKANLKPKLILDLQDEQMLFEVLDDREDKNLHLHAGAMIISKSVKPKVSHQRTSHGNEFGWQFNIANDNFYMNRKISQQLQSNSNKRTAYSIKVSHSAPAIKLQTMKLKLSNKDLANFHRPKALWYPHDNEVAVKEQGKLSTVGPMKVLIKSLGGKGSKLHVDAEETVSSIKVKASKKLDFKEPETVKIYYLGKELEDSKSLLAQNVRPNSLLHLVRTKIHVMPRAQKIPGANKSLRPPGAFKKKSELSVKDGHVFLMEYCEERPLLLSNIGMGANLCTYYQKSSPGDQSGTLLRGSNETLGNVVTLEPSDKSPFLGDIKAGCSQSCLETNLYKAPVFPHKVQSTDFLLVRSAKGKLSIRRIDKIAVVGQQEPLMEVYTPASKNLLAYLQNRLLVYVYREFRAAEKSGSIPWIRADELSAQFPNLPDTSLRKKLKDCAIQRRDARGYLFWQKKRDFTVPSEQKLKDMVLPEQVCSYESMQAGLYRLKHLGITRLIQPTTVSAAMSQLPDEAIALAAASHIERELLVTPWSLSSNFVSCTNQDRENIERLEITGVGDPSGRGLGFSYVRTTPKAPISNAMMKKKAVAGRGSTVTGTDADLRRLSMEAAREVLLKFNVPEEQIAKQTRWHRIAMIRKLSSEQAEMGVKVDSTTISKYARGQRMSYLQLQQQTREKCQEIWDRQVQSLSAVDGDEFGSDSEANSDLDSFAGDLENLLDAEECEGDVSNSEAKHDKSDSVKGIKMRRHPSQAQAEEENEDEAAEAAELCRLLMDDEEAEHKKKKKKAKAEGADAASFHGSKLNVIDRAERAKITKKSQLDLLPFTPKESNIRDSEIGTSSDKRKMSEKTKAMRSHVSLNPTPTTKKVKILGDALKNQVFKEKKSSRESFVCGACGQFGHMRTNKHCPKYREDPDSQAENSNLEKASGLEPVNKIQQKLLKKKSTPKISTRIGLDDDNSSLKVKSLPVKFKCSEKSSDKMPDGTGQSSDQPTTSDTRPVNSDAGNVPKPTSKVNKIIISNKAKPEDSQGDSHKPSIVIRPPADTNRNQVESHKPSIVIRPPTNTDRDESPKPSIVIRPPGGKDKTESHKKIVIKRSKEIIDLDAVSPDVSTGFEKRKTKKIVELTAFDMSGKRGNMHFGGESATRVSKEEKRWWEEEKKRRNMERIREERASSYGQEMRMFEAHDRVAEIKRYEESIRREREEEARKKAKKKKKKKRISINDDYLEEYKARPNDRRMAERDRGVKRRPVIELAKYGADASSTKRRKGGEVGLANILENIVDALRAKSEISYLFLKPVTKKEAPDYLTIIKKPMDLSTIKEKVRKMEYKDRDQFRKDVWQIQHNAHRYNDGRNPGIPPLADQLMEYCDYLLEQDDEVLAEAEASIYYGDH